MCVCRGSLKSAACRRGLRSAKRDPPSTLSAARFCCIAVSAPIRMSSVVEPPRSTSRQHTTTTAAVHASNAAPTRARAEAGGPAWHRSDILRRVVPVFGWLNVILTRLLSETLIFLLQFFLFRCRIALLTPTRTSAHSRLPDLHYVVIQGIDTAPVDAIAAYAEKLEKILDDSAVEGAPARAATVPHVLVSRGVDALVGGDIARRIGRSNCKLPCQQARRRT